MRAVKNEPRLVHGSHDQKKAHARGEAPYLKLAGMIGVHFAVMYALMYLMVNTFQDVFLNANNFYMSGAMAAPMAIVMLFFMKGMYPNGRTNAAVFALSVTLLVAFIWFTRRQAFVGNEQFVKSMVPHHSGAILMCREAAITDPELKSLCARIITSQQEEIDQMKAILDRPQGSER